MSLFKTVFSILLVLMLSTGAYAQDGSAAGVHAFSVKNNAGETVSLADYSGKVLLIVNTASRCGFTPQLGSMEKLYQAYKDKGVEVLAFPSDSFNQEPGSAEEIKKFCMLNYKTTFPLFDKISVKGDNIDPLYAYLTQEAGFDGAVSWNFNKFLVDANGQVVARYPSGADPMSEQVTGKIDELLAAE